MNSRDTAVKKMLDLVTDPAHGYSQYHRDGPDYDCSSSVCEAYGLSHGTTSTIPELFKANGAKVYTWDGNMADLEPGDLIGTRGKHVVMYVGNGKIAEFRIDEDGTIAGRRQGDQTGTESWVRSFYVPSYGWQYVVSPPGGGSSADLSGTRYRVRVSGRWLPEMAGERDLGGSSDDFAGIYGKPVEFLAVKGAEYQVKTAKSGWLPWVTGYDTGNLDTGCAGDGSNIVAVRIKGKRYQTHGIGGSWLPVMDGLKDTGGSTDDFAGDGKVIDAIRIW